MKKFLTVIFLFFLTSLSSYASEDSFNLAGVIENIINYDAGNTNSLNFDAKENFMYATNKFMQGNVVVAYSEYEKTINELDKNFPLFMIAKKLYENGFFSLGDLALSKISTNGKFKEQIQLLKDTYYPSYTHTKEEESYLAREYTQIYFNNAPEEAAFNLVKKDALLENSDYANFILAKSLFECKQYQQALIYVDKAIEKNDLNSNYKYLKISILINFDKSKEALKYIEENQDTISVYFKNDVKILKQKALFNLAKNEDDKKFYQLYGTFLAGNYYKTLKEASNILNFNKNNYKILTLQGMSYLAIGQFDEANKIFFDSYKINKKFPLTILGLGDCYFVEGDYDKAIKFYKTLINSEYKNEALAKTELIYDIQKVTDKSAAKNKKLIEKIKDNLFYEYYLIADNLLNDNESYKRKYAAKSLALNPLFLGSWNILFDMNYKKNEFNKINSNLFILSFLDNPNAEFYYYSAILLDKENNKKESFYELKKALNINPDYQPAIDMMAKLQNELI